MERKKGGQKRGTRERREGEGGGRKELEVREGGMEGIRMRWEEGEMKEWNQVTG